MTVENRLSVNGDTPLLGSAAKLIDSPSSLLDCQAHRIASYQKREILQVSGV